MRSIYGLFPVLAFVCATSIFKNKDVLTTPTKWGTGPACIVGCSGRPDGVYQSCDSCQTFIRCISGRFYENETCGEQLVWDDNVKGCVYSPSGTCWTNGPCTYNCSNKRDGNYQSCKSCDVYVTCVNGILYADQPCMDGKVWDESIRECDLASSTCIQD
ncbi:hypothetical protein SNE40_015882 [Patella caerulea]|uniref:Chitin-binding type-2 domain-containing protein n=1 Tax=Patella caerulea TaxID=87958 RepID=A0AAN8J7S7_PATCE